LLALASPPGLFPGAEFLVFVALAGVMKTTQVERGWKLAMYLAGFVYYAIIAYSTIYIPVPGYYAIPVIGGFWFVAVGAIVRLGERRLGKTATPVIFALTWVLYEWFKGHVPVIPYPHAQAAHALYEWPTLLRPVRFVGEPGMNFIVAYFAAAGIAFVERTCRVQIVAATIGWLVLVLPPSTLEPDGLPLRVRSVQTGVRTYKDQTDHVRLDTAREFLAHYRKLAHGEPRPDLCVWPEGAVPGYLVKGEESAGIRVIFTAIEDGASQLVGAGFVDTRAAIREPTAPRWNAAVLFSPSGKYLGRHEKHELVPLGEELPIAGFLSEKTYRKFLDWMSQVTGGLVPNLRRGRDLPIPRLPDGRGVGAPLCFENAFPDRFAKMANDGASLFCVLSNEGWYRLGTTLDQMLAMTVFRALETGRPVLRSTRDGWTAWVDGEGRIVEVLPLIAPGRLDALVQPVRGARLAMGWGPRLPWIALALVAMLIALGRWPGKPDSQPHGRKLGG